MLRLQQDGNVRRFPDNEVCGFSTFQGMRFVNLPRTFFLKLLECYTFVLID